jgi:hypothetical protein
MLNGLKNLKMITQSELQKLKMKLLQNDEFIIIQKKAEENSI